MTSRIRYKATGIDGNVFESNLILCGLMRLIVTIDLIHMVYSINDFNTHNEYVNWVRGTSRQDLMKKAKKKLQELGVQFKVEDKRKKKRIEAITKVINKAAEEMNVEGTK